MSVTELGKMVAPLLNSFASCSRQIIKPSPFSDQYAESQNLGNNRHRVVLNADMLAHRDGTSRFGSESFGSPDTEASAYLVGIGWDICDIKPRVEKIEKIDLQLVVRVPARTQIFDCGGWKHQFAVDQNKAFHMKIYDVYKVPGTSNTCAIDEEETYVQPAVITGIIQCIGK